jgi:hypothetical protein
MSGKRFISVRLSDVKGPSLPTPQGPFIPPKIEQLVALEPRLTVLLAEAGHYHETAGPTFCANSVFYGYFGQGPGLKSRLSKIVGWYSRQKGLLGTAAAYDVVYQTVWNALPACGPDCACQRVNREMDAWMDEKASV